MFPPGKGRVSSILFDMLQLVDVKNRKQLLRRIRPTEDINSELLFIGSMVTVYSRQLKIVEYGDEYTRSRMEPKSERTLALIKPEALQHLGKILNAVYMSGFHVR